MIVSFDINLSKNYLNNFLIFTIPFFSYCFSDMMV